MSDDLQTLSVAECAQHLCAEVTQSEGAALAARVLVQAFTPGLRYFNAAFKEILGEARNRRAPEVESLIKEHTELEPMFRAVCTGLKSAQSAEWWQGIIEVAECGAQRGVLTRLIDKQITISPEARMLRARWQRAYLMSGGGNPLTRSLTEKRSPAEQVPIQEIAQVAISYLNIPRVTSERQGEWLVAQRKFIESALSQSWREARAQLRDLVKIAPKDPMVYLYWALTKCAEGKVSEAINGVCRAAEMDPQSPELSRLLDESSLWRAAMEAEELATRAPHPSSPTSHLLAATVDGASLARTMDAPAHLRSQVKQEGAPLSSPRSPEGSFSEAINPAWYLPAELLQALAELGPERTLDVSISGLMGQLYHLINMQGAHLKDALKSYPEAQGLKALGSHLAQTKRLVERGLGVYRVDPRGESPPITIGPSLTGLKTLSPAELAELRRSALYPLPTPSQEASASPALSQVETPPPIPAAPADGSAPTEMLHQLSSVDAANLTPSPQSLSVEGAEPIDFTLEPEITDLARAEQLMQRGEFTQAEHCLLSLLDQNPFDAPVHNDLGVLYFQTQRFGDAKAHLTLSIECDPHYEEAWSNLVELFASLGQLHHALPLFRRFQVLVEGSASLRRLRELCARFAPEGLDQLPPPRYDDTAGLKLPLSGSFFISPAPDEDIFESISAPLLPEWSVEEQEQINEERDRVLQDRAVKLRSEINQLLEEYTRSSAPQAKAQPRRGLLSWVKERIGLSPPDEELEVEPIDQLSGEEQLEAIYNPEGPPPPPPQHLPEDMRRVRNIAFSMLCVPAGSFKMGTHINSPYGCSNETPQHTVIISRPFQLAQVPVTQELYQAVTFRNPSHIKAPGHPVVRVSWLDAIRFCNALSELEGLPSVYVIARGARPEVAIRDEVAGYRLPTEAEWEFCARARQPFRYAGAEEVHLVGWAQTDQLKTVARKDANGWGFYDMSGNVWEWCQDGMREYSSESQLDPKGEQHPYMHTPSARVIRGGSWCFEEDGARVAFRGRGALGLRISSLGFRVARSL